ncbi:MAG: hypothetical protein CMJ81_22980 [Planctomycetaceae bacterium]|nr:hypothetical protein [Planctomycetaceae bacterium]MBP60236.1 hypothetical protein [Planctomycetaceae bacterium]
MSQLQLERTVASRRNKNAMPLLAAFLVLTVIVLLVWLTPRATGDTFMALAGGQDVLDGKLGQPDDWSFMTSGRVWVNQSWATGLMFYLAHMTAGGNGLVAIKAAMIVMLATFLVLTARQLGARPAVGAIVSAAMLLAARHFIEIRPNLVGLTLIPMLMWILFASRERPQRIWFAVILVALWAHLHGSFIFAIGMLGLWTVCSYVMLLQSPGRVDAWKQHWHLPLATVSALVLTVISPYGITNLTQPFTLLLGIEGEAWPSPAVEMKPIFADDTKQYTAGLREFFLVLGFLAAPVLVWVYHRKLSFRLRLGTNHFRNDIRLVFSLCLLGVVIVMACCARRFVPIALLVSTPVLAFEFQWLLDHRLLAWPTAIFCSTAAAISPLLETKLTGPGKISTIANHLWGNPLLHTTFVVDQRLLWLTQTLVIAIAPLLLLLLLRRWGSGETETPVNAAALESEGSWFATGQRIAWPTLAVASFLFVGALTHAPRLKAHYRADHFEYPQQTFYERMAKHSFFPTDAASFLNDNEIAGHVYNDWRWEGFLRWHCPQIKVFLGGRSRQVYSARAARIFQRLGNGQDIAALPGLGVNLVVLQAQEAAMADALMKSRQPDWTTIYHDGNAVILAHDGDAPSRELIAAAAAGRLKYSNPVMSKLSRAICLCSPSLDNRPEEILEAAEVAVLGQPMPAVYRALGHALNANKLSPDQLVSFLESELRRLEGLDFHQVEGIHILTSRYEAARTLGLVYRALRRSQDANLWFDYSTQIRLLAESVSTGSDEPAIPSLPRSR